MKLTLPTWRVSTGPVLVLVAALLILTVRRMDTVFRAEPFEEDGQVFLLGTYFGAPWATILRPYEGYLHLVPRVAALASRAVPIQDAPVVLNAVALLVTAAVAAFIASKRLSSAIPDDRLRVLLAFLVVMMPGIWEPLGSVTYSGWYLALFLCLRIVADPPGGRFERSADRVAVLLSALSTPVSILLVPLYLWRCREAAPWVVFGAVVQLLVALVSPRFASTGEWDIQTIALTVVSRGLLEPMLGVKGMSFLIGLQLPGWLAAALAAAFIAAMLMVLFELPRAALLGGVYVAVATIAAGLVAAADRGPVFLVPGLAQRYFLISGALLMGGVVVAFWRRPHPLGFVLVATLTCAVIADFIVPSWPSHNWPSNSACIGGSLACVVPVEPDRIWSIRWPGEAGTYVQAPIGR